MSVIDLNSLDEYIDQRIDAKLNDRLKNLKVVAWCTANGDGNHNPLTIVDGYNIKSIEYLTGNAATWKVNFINEIPLNYVVLVSVEASGIAAELHGVYQYNPTYFMIDNVHLKYTASVDQLENDQGVVNNIGVAEIYRLDILVLKSV